MIQKETDKNLMKRVCCFFAFVQKMYPSQRGKRVRGIESNWCSSIQKCTKVRNRNRNRKKLHGIQLLFFVCATTLIVFLWFLFLAAKNFDQINLFTSSFLCIRNAQTETERNLTEALLLSSCFQKVLWNQKEETKILSCN